MRSLYGIHWYDTIAFKLIFLIGATVLVINSYLGFLSLEHQKRQIDQATRNTALKLSDTIRYSIHEEMLENRRDRAYRIMQTIGGEAGIERVRLFNEEGLIVFSTDGAEKGRMVDKKGEACTGCHAGGDTRKHIEAQDRARILRSPKGHRVMGLVSPIYNEPACATGECHVHPEAKRVLGAIDITLSLSDVDRQIEQGRNQAVFFTALSIAAIGAIVFLIVLGFVDRPAREITFGTVMVANGDLHHVIPTVSKDELGHLARSFNQMTANLATANAQVEEHMKVLEERFEEKAKALDEAQRQLLHNEKLSALGKIVATVAHEINNPLTGVFTYIKLMQRKLREFDSDPEKKERFESYLGVMSREVERTTSIVLNLLEFTRPKEPAKTRTSLNGLVDESTRLLENKFVTHGIELTKEFGDLPPVSIDPSQMKNVVINLVVNAAEAMEEGGTLSIRTFCDPDGRSVRLTVADTGPGIPADVIGTIFDPFFTTKGKGTGLGLSVVDGIVRKHDGRIEVESVEGKGTSITVVLPVGA
jgi:two-component system NtrC family sensor kinase